MFVPTYTARHAVNQLQLLHVVASGVNSKRTHKPVEDANHEQPTSSLITTLLYCCLTHSSCVAVT